MVLPARRIEAAVKFAGGRPNAVVPPVATDMGKPTECQVFSAWFKENYSRLDGVFGNAGVFGVKKRLTEDGWEHNFGINHLGHVALITPLLPMLNECKGRLVMNSSEAHQSCSLNGDALDWERARTTKGAALDRYGTSKLANLLFQQGVQARYPDIVTAAVHPGRVGSGITNNIVGRNCCASILSCIMKTMWLTPTKAAPFILSVLLSPDVKPGGYYHKAVLIEPTTPKKVNRWNPVANSPWKLSGVVESKVLVDHTWDKSLEVLKMTE